MGHTNNRKYLLSVLYKTIFKEIYPIDVGHAYHADRINQYSKQRKLTQYHYDDYAYLRLHVDSAAETFSFKCDINEGNFHNWMQGISNPKYIIIINSILEYILDACRDVGKYELLKSRILMILKTPEFHQYTGDLIQDTVQMWITQIELNDAEVLFKATKEIMYLLKNKEIFIPYLLKDQQILKSYVIVDMSDTSDKGICNAQLSSSTSSDPTFLKTTKPIISSKKFLYPLSVGIILMLILFANFLPPTDLKGLIKINHHDGSEESITAPNNVTTNVSTATASTESNASEIETASSEASTIKGAVIDIPSGNSLIKDTDNSGALDSTSAETVLATTDSIVSDTDGSDFTSSKTKDPNESNSSIASKETNFAIQNNNSATNNDTNNEVENYPSSLPIISDTQEAPTILNPANASSLNASDITFEWKSVSNATCYYITIVDTASWATIYTVNDIIGTSIVLDKALFTVGRQYRIYISSVFDEQTSTPNYIDITIEGLLAPKITSPSNEDVLSLSDVTFRWNPVSSATGYVVAVTNTSIWESVLDEKLSPCSSYTLDHSLFLPGQSYRIYITSVFDAVYSDPNYIDIQIKELPSPEFTYPADGEVLPLDNLTLTWLPVSLASCYGITITDTVSWTYVYTCTDITNTSQQLDKSLFIAGRSYRIYIYSTYESVNSVPFYIDINIRNE